MYFNDEENMGVTGKCNICNQNKKAELSAMNKQNLKKQIKVFDKYFICKECLDDPDKQRTVEMFIDSCPNRIYYSGVGVERTNGRMQ